MYIFTYIYLHNMCHVHINAKKNCMIKSQSYELSLKCLEKIILKWSILVHFCIIMFYDGWKSKCTVKKLKFTFCSYREIPGINMAYLRLTEALRVHWA